MPTQTAPVQHAPVAYPQIAKLVADGRAQLIAHVDGEIAGLKAELATLQDTRKALTGRNGGGGEASATAMKPANGERTTSAQRSRPTAAGKAAGNAGAAPSKEAVLEAVRSGVGHNAPAIAKALGSNAETILRRLSTLTDDGLLVREGERSKTTWSIPAAGAVAG